MFEVSYLVFELKSYTANAILTLITAVIMLLFYEMKLFLVPALFFYQLSSPFFVNIFSFIFINKWHLPELYNFAFKNIETET
jgi:hypothetical protein